MKNFEDFIDLTEVKLQPKSERDVKNYFHAMCYWSGFIGKNESQTDKGYVDYLLEVNDIIYVFEFKFNFSAEGAFNCIKEREYDKYILTRYPKMNVYKIGVNYDSLDVYNKKKKSSKNKDYNPRI